MRTTHTRPLFALSLLSLAIASSVAHAQQPAQKEEVEEIVVTGYKASLQSATNAKRASTSLVESVFAEDIGKFPDLNVAESIGRIPGIQLTRDINGDGLQIAIRGLGTNFTKVLLNGSQIAVASGGSVDSQNQNREVDLNLFPTELFTRIDVSKTPVASTLEGGLAGVVNMRSARPFDSKDEGFHSTYQGQLAYTEINEETSPRAAFTTSWRNENFGVLFGLAGVNSKSTTEGYETIGWSNMNLSAAQCGTATAAPCDTIGGNNINVPATVPAGAGAGLVAGTVVDAAFLQANNPNVTLQQIGDGLLPRLSRPSYIDGTRDRVSGLLSLEYRPSDETQFYFDAMWADASREFDRLDVNWIGRFGSLIPLNMEVDENNVVTKGTFANAQFFLEARPYSEDVDFYNVNPGAHFEFGSEHQLDVQINSSRSEFFRESPTVLINTPMGQGTVVNYENTGGDYPQVTTNVDLNDPNAGWVFAGGRLNIANEKRITETDGAHVDYRFGDDVQNIRFGLAYDEISRSISARDNSARWEDVVCRNGLDADGNSPATGRLPCNGLNPNSGIPQSELASYLKPGPYGFITVDFDRFMADTNYHELSKNAPENNSSPTGASTGGVDEETLGAYLEINGATEVAARPLTFNMGTRYITTDQLISGPVTIGGVREYQNLDTSYDAFLPSFNSTLDVMDDVKLRLSASRTLTRANPSAMLPATQFSDPSAQQATQGNPNLSPYLSTNFDIGGEWYTGDEGYVGVTFFNKQVTGFTVLGTNTIPFLQLGVPYDTLTDLQRGAIDSRGGPNVATVTVQQQVNAPGNLELRGQEITWVQPLDMIVEGLGFNANFTKIDQKGEGQGAPAQAIGVSPQTYNFTGYWENYGASLRLSYTWYDAQVISGPNQNGISFAQLKADERGQWDLSASYQFEGVVTEPMLTLNISNLTGEPLRTTYQYDNATFTFYDPGYTATLGIRGSF
ncbi:MULTISPECIES: TonB-dependent receptor [Cellvibrio]|uniref:TonB-dependent receptor n=1 Tax=Cellvibrio fibrivorans TaxID=126350 RepID=A0ABU1V0F7_9GAMM|nr:TonB-dependent receptor [Cellvibrio fibrivorans]MDR7090932.1 TonB-dependent receptor [Cellvibrio fibrivorans]